MASLTARTAQDKAGLTLSKDNESIFRFLRLA